MDYKTLFPVLENGVFFFDILMKHAICLDSRYWKETCNRDFIESGVNLEHITNLSRIRILSPYHQLTSVEKWQNTSLPKKTL
jgi:hypothetical protein